MSEEKIKEVIRDFSDAIAEGNVEKALSFFAEDATWVRPEGTFKGKEELARTLKWLAQSIPELIIIDTGVGIMVQGNKAIQEQLLKGITEGMKFSAPF